MSTRRRETTAAVLEERRATHGEFGSHARLAQALKRAMRSFVAPPGASPAWAGLDDDMKEALEMVQHKVARILNGDPGHADHWRDIAGYSELVARRLEEGGRR